MNKNKKGASTFSLPGDGLRPIPDFLNPLPPEGMSETRPPC